jgi:hypothetical protein
MRYFILRSIEWGVISLATLAVVGVFEGTASAQDIQLLGSPPPHQMPAIERGQIIAVRPGEEVIIKPTFNTTWENCISVFDQSNGKQLAHWNNYHLDKSEKDWRSGRNNTSETQILIIADWTKASPPNGKAWFLNLRKKVLDGGMEQGTTRIGFDEAGAGKYSSAIVNVTWASKDK